MKVHLIARLHQKSETNMINSFIFDSILFYKHDETVPAQHLTTIGSIANAPSPPIDFDNITTKFARVAGISTPDPKLKSCTQWSSDGSVRKGAM